MAMTLDPSDIAIVIPKGAKFDPKAFGYGDYDLEVDEEWDDDWDSWWDDDVPEEEPEEEPSPIAVSIEEDDEEDDLDDDEDDEDATLSSGFVIEDEEEDDDDEEEDEADGVTKLVEQDDELSDTGFDSTVTGFDDVDPFAGTASSVPTVTMEISDVLSEDLASSASTMKIRYEAEGIAYPYTPHPEAQAHDTCVVYDHDLPAYVEVANSVRKALGPLSRSIAGQLRRVLFASSVNRIQRDVQRGRLDRTKLHTLNRPGTIRPNRRVFSRKVMGKSHSVSVGLMIDQSGSMGGTKVQCAREATMALADALEQLAPVGVKFGVWGFDSDWTGAKGHMEHTDRNEPLRFHVYKRFSEHWKRVYGRLGAMREHANNCDGESIRWAAQQLLQEDTTRRVLIVLSDGSPHCGTSSSGHRIAADLKAAVREIAKSGIEIFGLGICDDSVSIFYPHYAVISKASELEGALMGKLKTMLIGS